MRYFLKKDLPGIKAGTEMERAVLSSGGGEIDSGHIFRPGRVVKISGDLLEQMWKGKESDTWHRIPDSELSDWIEERTDSMWKPKKGEVYFTPEPSWDVVAVRAWHGDKLDNFRFHRGVVCQTEKLAIELADRMIETAKKFWEEKK